MAILNYFNYKTRQEERIDDARLTDQIARQLIRQDELTQQIYVYARRNGASIGEAMARAHLEGRQK
jgi:hypothetical protein